MATIINLEIRRILEATGGEMERRHLIAELANRCGLRIKRARAACRLRELAGELGRRQQDGKDLVKLGAETLQEDHFAVIMAIVREEGPIQRQRLIELAMSRSGRAEQSCYGALRNLVATGELEREEHSRKQAIIREPATQTLLAILGGARLPKMIPAGRRIAGLCGGAGEETV